MTIQTTIAIAVAGALFTLAVNRPKLFADINSFLLKSIFVIVILYIVLQFGISLGYSVLEESIKPDAIAKFNENKNKIQENTMKGIFYALPCVLYLFFLEWVSWKSIDHYPDKEPKK